MKNLIEDKKHPKLITDKEVKIEQEEDLIYPVEEDIYNRSQKETIINTDVLTDKQLDVPGSELDDAQEDIGSEDEENNYYSLGGDEHNNLDEDPTE